MNNFPIRGIAFCILAPLALAGCDEAMMPLATDKSVSDEASFAAEGVTRTEVRDVERPDIFSASEDGLWDGIPNTGWLNPKTVVPTGTYFYVLHLNDPQFPDPYIGDLYVNY